VGLGFELDFDAPAFANDGVARDVAAEPPVKLERYVRRRPVVRGELPRQGQRLVTPPELFFKLRHWMPPCWRNYRKIAALIRCAIRNE
jgi:hypothetical protein